MSKSPIAEQIAALEVRVPSASRFQDHEIEQESKRRYRLGKRRPAGELDRQRAEEVFALIVQAALKGERCPTWIDLSLQQGWTGSSPWFSMLARTGRIRIEVSSKNWRTVWICDGPHRGLHTMLPPDGSKPYRVLGAPRP